MSGISCNHRTYEHLPHLCLTVQTENNLYVYCEPCGGGHFSYNICAITRASAIVADCWRTTAAGVACQQ